MPPENGDAARPPPRPPAAKQPPTTLTAHPSAFSLGSSNGAADLSGLGVTPPPAAAAVPRGLSSALLRKRGTSADTVGASTWIERLEEPLCTADSWVSVATEHMLDACVPMDDAAYVCSPLGGAGDAAKKPPAKRAPPTPMQGRLSKHELDESPFNGGILRTVSSPLDRLPSWGSLDGASAAPPVLFQKRPKHARSQSVPVRGLEAGADDAELPSPSGRLPPSLMPKPKPKPQVLPVVSVSVDALARPPPASPKTRGGGSTGSGSPTQSSRTSSPRRLSPHGPGRRTMTGLCSTPLTPRMSASAQGPSFLTFTLSAGGGKEARKAEPEPEPEPEPVVEEDPRPLAVPPVVNTLCRAYDFSYGAAVALVQETAVDAAAWQLVYAYDAAGRGRGAGGSPARERRGMGVCLDPTEKVFIAMGTAETDACVGACNGDFLFKKVPRRGARAAAAAGEGTEEAAKGSVYLYRCRGSARDGGGVYSPGDRLMIGDHDLFITLRNMTASSALSTFGDPAAAPTLLTHGATGNERIESLHVYSTGPLLESGRGGTAAPSSTECAPPPEPTPCAAPTPDPTPLLRRTSSRRTTPRAAPRRAPAAPPPSGRPSRLAPNARPPGKPAEAPAARLTASQAKPQRPACSGVRTKSPPRAAAARPVHVPTRAPTAAWAPARTKSPPRGPPPVASVRTKSPPRAAPARSVPAAAPARTKSPPRAAPSAPMSPRAPRRALAPPPQLALPRHSAARCAGRGNEYKALKSKVP
eukprot:TRINITY_DN5657_c0_g1_i1.p1 TRINITY_DN5657_c0_g1~~TRINITY_DN5657_c0_g1_i1.p1  ORF type:complete len:754 (+),score=158.43 TRINITY_DN5657_c0_g1_i1:66-2327(+)